MNRIILLIKILVYFVLCCIISTHLACRQSEATRAKKVLVALAQSPESHINSKTTLEKIPDRVIEFWMTTQDWHDDEIAQITADECREVQKWIISLLQQVPEVSFIVQKESDDSSQLLAITRKTFSSTRIIQKRAITDHLARGLIHLTHFLYLNEEVHRELLDPNHFLSYCQNQRTIEAILLLIAHDKNNRYSETGGFVTINQNSSLPYLQFYTVPSESEALTRTLYSLSANPLQVLEYIRTHTNEFLMLKDELQIFLREIDKYHDENKIKRINQFLSHYFAIARLTYYPSISQYYFRIMQGDVTGFHLGGFHVHPPENEASFEDKQESFFSRNLIIVPTPEGFRVEFHFYGSNPNQKPVLFTFSKSELDGVKE